MIIWTDIESTGLSPAKDYLLEVALVVTDDDLNEVAATSVVMQPLGIFIDSAPMDKVVVEMHTKNGLLDEIRAMEKGERPPVRRHEAEQQLLAFVKDAFKLVPPVASEKCAHCGRGKKDHAHGMQLQSKTLDEGAAAATYDVSVNCTADGYHGSSFVAKYLPAVSQTPLAGSTIAFDRSFLLAHMPSLHSKFHYRSIDVSSLTELAKRWSPAVYEARPKKDDGAAHRALPDIRESIEYLRYYRAAGFINATCKGYIEQARAHRDYFKDGCPFENCDVCSSLGERMRGA